MVTIEIADEIYRELSNPSELSVPSIAFWLRGHIGDLNNLISTSYSISTTDGATIEPEIGDNEKSILKKLFNIYYYDLKIKNNLGAAANDILEVTSDGATIRVVNKNEISKSYIAFRKEEGLELTRLINRYNNNVGIPQHIAGDDTISEDSESTYFEPIRE